MAAHNRDARFYGIGFEMTILEQSSDKTHIENRESHWVAFYDSHEKGLNRTETGAGWGHEKRGKFTTAGYIYSEKSRKKMSDSAKKRCQREGHQTISERSKKAWRDPEYRARQEGKRAGRRLRPPKLSDSQCVEIRSKYLTTHAISLAKEYGVSRHTIDNIGKNRTRTCPLPAAYNLKS